MHIFIIFLSTINSFGEMLVLHLGFPRPRWWPVGRRWCQGSCPATGSEWPRLSHQDTQPIYQCWGSTRFWYGHGSPYRNVSFYLYFIYKVRATVRFYFHVSYQKFKTESFNRQSCTGSEAKIRWTKTVVFDNFTLFLIWSYKHKKCPIVIFCD